MARSKLPRGLRNNNCGNIRKSADKWQGLAPEQPDSDFFTFVSQEYGVRALARTLITYQDRYDLRTVAAIINRWAPPNENDTGAYVGHVAALMGVSTKDQVDVHRYETMRPLVEAIIKHENAGQTLSGATIDKGLDLAGVLKPAAPLVKSPKAWAPPAFIGTAAAATLNEGLQQASSAISQVKTVASNGTALASSLGIDFGTIAFRGVLTLLCAGGVIAAGWYGWRWWQDRLVREAAAKAAEAGEPESIDLADGIEGDMEELGPAAAPPKTGTVIVRPTDNDLKTLLAKQAAIETTMAELKAMLAKRAEPPAAEVASPSQEAPVTATTAATASS